MTAMPARLGRVIYRASAGLVSGAPTVLGFRSFNAGVNSSCDARLRPLIQYPRDFPSILARLLLKRATRPSARFLAFNANLNPLARRCL